MAQTQVFRGVQTRITRTNNGIIGYYHSTAVVVRNALEKTVTLNSGGWMTNTTKLRMNQFANQFGLKYSVYQKKGQWYVVFGGREVEYFDGMVFFVEGAL